MTEESKDILTPGTIALLAALIGAIAAIIPQIIMHFLDRNKSKRQEIRNIIGEERRLAFLLEEYYKELVMYKTHKQYWYKVSILPEFDEKDRDEAHKTHLEKNQKSFETMDKIRVATADYFKTITLFLRLNGDNSKIEKILEEIKCSNQEKQVNTMK
nr:hypothetical protein [uncultured Allomuricauda sp.]